MSQISASDSSTNVHALPVLSDNYIWCIVQPSIRDIVVIDPAVAEPVLDLIHREELTLRAILVTHHHPDHTGGVAELKRQTGCKVYASGLPASRFHDFDEACIEGDRITLLGIEFEVLEVPGHTLDHIAYFAAADNNVEKRPPWLFCGDTLFSAGCGRLFEGSPAQLHSSLSRLNQLPADTLVFCTHEYTLVNLAFAQMYMPNNPALQSYQQRCQQLRKQNLPTLPSCLAQERRINPFLNLRDPQLREALVQRAGLPGVSELDSDVTTFKYLRQQRDEFNRMLRARTANNI